MNRLIFAFIFILSTSLTFGQGDYVITTSGDSLTGKVNLLLPGKFHEEVMIKDGKNKQRLKSYQVTRLVTKGQEYHTVKLGNIYKFMLIDKKGYVSIYRFRTADSFEFSSQYLAKTGGKGVEVPNFTFKKLIGEFVSDCPDVEEKINDKTYKRGDLEKIVDEYNSCIAAGEVYSYNQRQKQIESADEVALIDQIVEKLKGADSNNELITLLGDIKAKLNSGNDIPKYLKSALKDQTKDMAEIKEEVKKLLEKLP